MTEEQKKEYCNFPKSILKIIDQAKENGLGSLTKGQKNKLHRMDLYMIARTIPGDLDDVVLENHLKDAGIPPETAAETKNPFTFHIAIYCATAVLSVPIGYLFLKLGIKWLALGFFLVPVAALPAIFYRIAAAVKFKKLQNKYVSGKRDEERINAQIASLVLKDLRDYLP